MIVAVAILYVGRLPCRPGGVPVMIAAVAILYVCT